MSTTALRLKICQLLTADPRVTGVVRAPGRSILEKTGQALAALNPAADNIDLTLPEIVQTQQGVTVTAGVMLRAGEPAAAVLDRLAAEVRKIVVAQLGSPAAQVVVELTAVSVLQEF